MMQEYSDRYRYLRKNATQTNGEELVYIKAACKSGVWTMERLRRVCHDGIEQGLPIPSSEHGLQINSFIRSTPTSTMPHAHTFSPTHTAARSHPFSMPHHSMPPCEGLLIVNEGPDFVVGQDRPECDHGGPG